MNVAVKEKLQNQKGFTIIEVVLVLAIAGLIFLMVFIALPALQSSQRDTARKNDASAVASAYTTYTGNNRGKVPSSANLTSYVTNKSDNTTTIEVATAGTTGTVQSADGKVTIYPGSKCTTDSTLTDKTKQPLAKGTSRQFATVTYLEAGGGSAYCQDS